MIEWLAASFIVVAFAVLLVRLRVVSSSREVIALSRQAMAVITGQTLTDRDKERRLQAYTGALLKAFLFIVVGSAAAVGVPILLVWALEFTGVLQLNAVLAVTVSWSFLLAATLVSVPLFYLLSRKKG